MASRFTVPPRREAIIQQYTAAHEAACLAKDAAEKLEGWAEAANDRRDFRGASHFWERSCRESANCKKHRERELELRKEEYALYNHLDDDNEREGHYKLIEYSERRIERLRGDMSKRLVKSRISHLKQYVIKQETQSRQIEKQIIEEDLRNKAKGRSNIAFGSGWDEVGDGWGHRPPQRKDVHQNAQAKAADRLRWLEGQKKYFIQQADSSIEAIRQNEIEWEAIREKEQIRDAEWNMLDDDARRHWASLPVKDYEADAYKALEKQREEEAAARQAEESAQRLKQEEIRQQRIQQQKLLEEQRRQQQILQKEAEEARKQQEALEEAQRQSQADEQARWEEEYALEEDPEFTWKANEAAVKAETAGTAVPDKDEEMPSAEDTFLPKPDAGANAVQQVEPETKSGQFDDQGWGADFDKALLEGDDDFKGPNAATEQEDNSIFDEYLEHSAFKDGDEDAPGSPVTY